MINEKSKSAEDEILALARKQFRLAEEAERDFKALAIEDQKFRIGEQWPDDVKHARALDKRPCLTINRIPQFIRQVTNDQRQNRPSIKVNPVDEGADIETAKILQGLIRHIEYNSNADVAYDTAFEHAVTGGFGYIRAVTDYCDPMSFDQEILIKRVKNAHTVYFDPHSQEPDGSDANYAFIVDDISIDEFKKLYPDSKLSSSDDWQTLGDEIPGWAQGNTVRIAEYWRKEFKEITLCLLNNGQAVDKAKLEFPLPEGFSIVSERKSQVPIVKWYKINACEILEETEWPGKWIPIVPVLGDEVIVSGTRVLEGIVRHAKDPQRMYNFWASNETETIALTPRAPYIGVAGQFAGFEAQWKTANVRNHAYLEYKPVSVAGQPAPPPQRVFGEPAVGAITNARMQSAEDMKATTGIYDASLGARSNENSGIAIQRRNIQAQTSNFHFIDNLSRALRHLGRILVDAIPHVYDTARAVRIIGEEGNEEIIRINEVFEKKGEKQAFYLSKGKYDVTVSTGPSFQTKRQEAVQSMLSLTQSAPHIAQVASDLMVKNMDWPGASEIAERLKKTLPPGLAEDDGKDKKPVPPEVQAQMAQMGQLIDQLTQQLNQANDERDKKLIEIESRERIEFAKMQVQAEIELAKLGSKEGLALLQHEVAEIQQRLDLLRQNEPIEIGDEMAMPPDQMQGQFENQPLTGEESPGQSMGV